MFSKTLKINKKSFYYAEQTANALNSFSMNVGTPLLEKSIPSVSTSYTGYLMFFNDFVIDSVFTI